MSKGKILFQLSGSIACFKACQAISLLAKDGFEIETVLSPSALNFIGTATVEGLTGRKVHTDTFCEGRQMSHIWLTRWADIIVLCPATANSINKLSSGIGDDLISNIFLAHDFSKPYLIFPAMNEKMLLNPATKNSIQTLKAWGIEIQDSNTGDLACGEIGVGRLLEPEQILMTIQKFFQNSVPKIDKWKPLGPSPIFPDQKSTNRSRPQRVIITAGGTTEPIDGVRSIKNISTGKTGIIIADHFSAAGYDVTLLLSEDAFKGFYKSYQMTEVFDNSYSDQMKVRTFLTFQDLYRLLREELSSNNFDVIVNAAAVSDYSIDKIEASSNGVDKVIDHNKFYSGGFSGKIESADQLILKLKKNPKIIDEIRSVSSNKNIKVIAFKLTSGASAQERKSAMDKLIDHARPDIVVCNDALEVGSEGHLTQIYMGPKFTEVARTETKQQLAMTLQNLLSEENRVNV